MDTDNPRARLSFVRTVLVTVVTTLIVVAAAYVGLSRTTYIKSKFTAEPVQVSMAALISNPERYDGVKVRVIGYMKLEFEGDRLCISRETSEVFDGPSCIWVNRAASMPNTAAQTELIEGTFSSSEHGHMGMFGGTLNNITRAQRWSTNFSSKYRQPLFYTKGVASSDDLAQCKSKKGRFEDVGDYESCMFEMPDASKVCTDNDQCTGACIYVNDGKHGSPPFANISGQCQAKSIQLGCFGEVRHGSVESINCFDVPKAE